MNRLTLPNLARAIMLLAIPAGLLWGWACWLALWAVAGLLWVSHGVRSVAADPDRG